MRMATHGCLVLEVTTDNDAGMSQRAELVHGSGVAAKELAFRAGLTPGLIGTAPSAGMLNLSRDLREGRDKDQSITDRLPAEFEPSYLFRDNDGVYGDEVGRFLVGTGIAEVKTAHHCPWQNPFVERYGGTLRRELLDHVVVLNEGHLKRLLKEFIEEYYHRARRHQGLQGDTPVSSAKPEPVADVSRLVSILVVGGLHHRYIRVAA
jgi:hypothetical protein